jgi:hypothetical protein
MIIASVLTAIICYGIYKIFVIDDSIKFLLIIKTFIMVVTIFIIYMIFAHMLRIVYVKELLGRMYGYIRRRKFH